MTAPYQSKLIPYEDFIRECRAKRWSYPRIAKALLEQHGLKTGAATIFDFVKVRARKKSLIELPSSSCQKTEPKPTSAMGFFEPAADSKPYETRKPKFNINL